MKKLLFSALALLVAGMPFANAVAENINIYAWQNYSWEFISVDRNDKSDRDFDRIGSNSAHIGFMAHMDTGMPGLQVGLECEQATYYNHFDGAGHWCGRDSKISLRHETMGEIMFANWLLPYNEIVAQWVDPFYDAGPDSHTSIMGNIGFAGNFYGPGANGINSLNFNRRQEGIIQYVWPNTSAMADQSREGFQFRFAMTSGWNDESEFTAGDNTDKLDPRIYSTGISWQHNMMNGDQVWLAVAYENHDDWTAYELSKYLEGVAACDKSDDDGWRIAGRYTHDWGNGMDTMLAAMWEDLDYDTDGCAATNGDDVVHLWSDVERDAWMISGKHNFGNGFAFKFSYMNADDLDCPNNMCPSSTVGGQEFADGSTDADSWNVGLTYTMPAGTELRLTYTDVDNSAFSDYDLGIFTAGSEQGKDLDMWAIGIVHWFD